MVIKDSINMKKHILYISFIINVEGNTFRPQ